MPLLTALWRAAAGWFGRPGSEPAPEDARRRALRAVVLEQLRDSEWPCHPHF